MRDMSNILVPSEDEFKAKFQDKAKASKTWRKVQRLALGFESGDGDDGLSLVKTLETLGFWC